MQIFQRRPAPQIRQQAHGHGHDGHGHGGQLDTGEVHSDEMEEEEDDIIAQSARLSKIEQEDIDMDNEEVL